MLIKAIDSDQIIACSMERNFINGFKLIAGINDSTFTETAGTSEFFSGYGTSWLNCVFRADGEDASLEAIMTELLKKYSAICPMIWHVGVLTPAPQVVKNLLVRQGASFAGRTPGMLLMDSLLEPSAAIEGFEVRELAAASHIMDWILPFAEAFALPEHVTDHFQQFIQLRLGISKSDRWFIGYERDVPVCSAYYLNDSGISMIYNVSTREAFREKGYGRRIMEFVIEHALKIGDPIGLYASDMGLSLYEELGFKHLYYIEEFGYPAN